MTREKFESMINWKNRKYLGMSKHNVKMMLDKVIFPEDDNDCYGWLGQIDESGYAVFGWKRNKKSKKIPVHRALKILISGPPPENKPVSCHNKKSGKRCKCPNPFHIDWGTQKKNMKHRDKDGNATDNRGEKCGTSKLKEHQAIDIYKRAWKLENQREIAEEYEVAQSVVSKIKYGKLWGSVTKDIKI